MNWEKCRQLEAIRFIALDAIDSTQRYAKALKIESESDTIWAIVAEFQSKGQGRFQHQWDSEKGQDILCSLIIRPTAPVHKWPLLTLIFSYLLQEVLSEYIDSNKLKIKWPNDLLYEHQKCVGILAENHPHKDFLVLGFGINVNSKLNNSEKRTSLKNILGQNVDRDALLAKILKAFLDANEPMMNGQLEYQRWNDLAAYLGEQVSIQTASKQSVKGIFRGIDPEGRLILENNKGVLESFWEAAEFRQCME